MTLFVFIMCFVYQSRLMPLILLILTICPVFSFIVMTISFFAIRLKIVPVEIVAEKKEEVNIGLYIQNHFLFPVSPIRIVGDFQSADEHDFSRKVLMTDVPPLSSSVVQLPFRLPFRGEYTVRIYEVHVFDLLKLFRLKRKLELRARLIVLPWEKIPNHTGEETETDTESPASKITNHRSNMFNSLREYREGDSIRHIHWKMTAKQDELVVKQFEQSVNNSAVVFSDFSASFPEKAEKDGNYFTRRMLDAVLETGLAVTKQILLDGNSVINCWQGAGGSEKYELTEFAHYSYLYGVFTVLPQMPSEKSFAELIELFSPEIKEHHTIYLITPELDEKLLQTLEETGLAMREGVSIITFSAVTANDEITEYIKEKTKIKLLEIKDESKYFNMN